MKQLTINKSRGLTLTELLAVLMIISLLSTIAVPVYVARQEDARVRVAVTECRQIAMAEETVAAMHGFYVPFQLLDELPPDPDTDAIANDEERIDEHYDADNMHLINPTITAEAQINNQLVLSQGYENALDSHPRVRALVNNWSGPFISWQRFWYDTRPNNPDDYEGPSDDNYRNSDDLFRDFPLDPWGNPYRFYSPIGVIGNGDDHRGDFFNWEDPEDDFSNGQLTRNDEDRFQRYAVVSFGRDGVADTDTFAVPADHVYNDIYYEFGTDGVGRRFGQF